MSSSIIIDSVTELENHLEFDFKDIELSLVNGLRRIILTQIPSLVIRGFPHNENLIDITKNNTKYNNEYLKHRLSCIPILVSKQSQFKKIINDFVLKVNLKNDTNDKMTLTTEHIKLYNHAGKAVTYKGKLFLEPPIPICYLYPRISQSDPYEEFSATIKLSIGTAKEDSCWNMVSKCLFFNKEDSDENDKLLESMPPEHQEDFKLLEAQRNYLPNEYTFVIESVGVYNNKEILTMACSILIENLELFVQHMSEVNIKAYVPNIPLDGPYHIYKKKLADNDILYIIKLEHDDYTYGKLIEKYIYKKYASLFKFIAFKKEHPHDKHSLVQMVFLEKDSDDILKQKLLEIFNDIKIDLIHIQKEFKI